MSATILVYLISSVFFILGIILIKFSYRGRWRISSPELDIKKFMTTTKTLNSLKFLRQLQNEKKDREIYEAIAYLRNMTAIGKGRNVSSDFVIQQLAEHKGVLQKTYVKMLSYLRLNRKEEAIALFVDTVKTPISKEFARLLIQWDEIDPNGLSEILLSHQKNIKEVRITVQKKRDEMISDIIYLPVVLNVILIFINFIYVAYFLDQKEILQMFI